MESCSRKLCTHEEGPLLQRKNTGKGKLVNLSCFLWEMHGAALSLPCTDHTKGSSNSRDLQNGTRGPYIPVRQLLQERDFPLSLAQRGTEIGTGCSHPNHAHPLINGPERRAPGDPFGLVTNTNIALTTCTPNQPTWGVGKPLSVAHTTGMIQMIFQITVRAVNLHLIM